MPFEYQTHLVGELGGVGEGDRVRHHRSNPEVPFLQFRHKLAANERERRERPGERETSQRESDDRLGQDTPQQRRVDSSDRTDEECFALLVLQRFENQ